MSTSISYMIEQVLQELCDCVEENLIPQLYLQNHRTRAYDTCTVYVTTLHWAVHVGVKGTGEHEREVSHMCDVSTKSGSMLTPMIKVLMLNYSNKHSVTLSWNCIM